MSTTVEPNMVKRTIPASFNHSTMEQMPEKTIEQPDGYRARRGALQAWSPTKDGALSMLDRMEEAKRCA